MFRFKFKLFQNYLKQLTYSVVKYRPNTNMAEEGGTSQNARLKDWKNKGMDQTELRRRREEEGIQLRRQKREEQVRTSLVYLLFMTMVFFMSQCECLSS